MGVTSVYQICRVVGAITRGKYEEMRYDDILIDVSSVFFPLFQKQAYHYARWYYQCKCFPSFVQCESG
jgi:hypothetical protein